MGGEARYSPPDIRNGWSHLVPCYEVGLESRYMGVPMHDLTRDELIAALAQMSGAYERVLMRRPDHAR